MGGAKSPTLTLQMALRLQADLRDGFAEEGFQRKRMELESKYPKQNVEFVKERQKLVLTVQERVLPKYGFEGSQKGVFAMMSAFNEFNDDPEFQRHGNEIQWLLGLPVPPGWQPEGGSTPSVAKQES